MAVASCWISPDFNRANCDLRVRIFFCARSCGDWLCRRLRRRWRDFFAVAGGGASRFASRTTPARCRDFEHIYSSRVVRWSCAFHRRSLVRFRTRFGRKFFAKPWLFRRRRARHNFRTRGNDNVLFLRPPPLRILVNFLRGLRRVFPRECRHRRFLF